MPEQELSHSSSSKEALEEEFENGSKEDNNDIDILWIEDTSIKLNNCDVINKPKQPRLKQMRKRSYSKEDVQGSLNERLDTGNVSPEFVISDEEEYQMDTNITKESIGGKSTIFPGRSLTFPSS